MTNGEKLKRKQGIISRLLRFEFVSQKNALETFIQKLIFFNKKGIAMNFDDFGDIFANPVERTNVSQEKPLEQQMERPIERQMERSERSSQLNVEKSTRDASWYVDRIILPILAVIAIVAMVLSVLTFIDGGSISDVSKLSGTVSSEHGGTGQTSFLEGQLLIGTSSGSLEKNKLAPGSNFVVTNGDGTITLGLPTTLNNLDSVTSDLIKTKNLVTDTLTLGSGGLSISGVALTATSSAPNVSIALGGSPNTALFNSASIALGWVGKLSVNRGGTGLLTTPRGSMLWGSDVDTLATFNGNATETKMFLSQTGTGLFPSVPVWEAIPSVTGAPLTTNSTSSSPVTLTASPANNSALLSPVSLTVGWSGLLSPSLGGTGLSSLSYTKGSMIYCSTNGVLDTFQGNSSGSKNFLVQTSNNMPTWSAIDAGDISGILGPAFGGTGMTTYEKGSMIYSNAQGSLASFSGNSSGTRAFLSQSSNNQPLWSTILGSEVSGSQLKTESNFSRISLTTSNGSGALLATATITLNWNAGALECTNGGTGIQTYSRGQMLYVNDLNVLATFNGNNTGTRNFLTQQNNNVPQWGTIVAGDITSGILSVSNGGTGQATYTDGQLLIGNSNGNTLTKATLTQSSANRVIINVGNGSISLSTPQDINTTSQVQFGQLSIGSEITSGSSFLINTSTTSSGINLLNFKLSSTQTVNTGSNTALVSAIDCSNVINNGGSISTAAGVNITTTFNKFFDYNNLYNI